MTKATMALTELAVKGPDTDLLRQMIQFVAQSSQYISRRYIASGAAMSSSLLWCRWRATGYESCVYRANGTRRSPSCCARHPQMLHCATRDLSVFFTVHGRYLRQVSEKTCVYGFGSILA